MKVYVASSWRNERQPEVVKALREHGHEVYDFRAPEPDSDTPGGFHWSEIDPAWKSWTPSQLVDGLEHPLAQRGFGRDFRAMQWAEVILAVQPFGVSASLELGWGAGAGKSCGVVLANGEPELMLKMAHFFALTVEAAVAWVDAGAWRRG